MIIIYTSACIHFKGDGYNRTNIFIPLVIISVYCAHILIRRTMLVLKYVFCVPIISNSNNVRYLYKQYSICYTNWISELLSNGQTYKTPIPILCQRPTLFCVYQYNMLTIVYWYNIKANSRENQY